MAFKKLSLESKLSKEISFKVKYGYAPRGFLIDYFNTELLTEFTKAIKGFFFIRGYAFIKINPEITYATIDYKNKTLVNWYFHQRNES